MSVVLVVIIAVAWMVVLGPSLLKRRSRAGGINSISRFHRSLRILERSGPEPIVAPAYRLRSVPGSAGGSRSPSYPDVAGVPVLTVVGTARLHRPALAFLGEDPAPSSISASPALSSARPGRSVVGADAAVLPDGADGVRTGLPDHRPHVADPLVRHQVRKRRRDMLGVLAMVFMATVMIGFVPGAGAAWLISAVSGVALTGYVWLLVQLRRQAEERERKLHYLAPVGTATSLHSSGLGALGGVGVPVYMSGRYAHPSNQAAVGH
jgi:hypothetical protein